MRVTSRFFFFFSKTQDLFTWLDYDCDGQVTCCNPKPTGALIVGELPFWQQIVTMKRGVGVVLNDCSQLGSINPGHDIVIALVGFR